MTTFSIRLPEDMAERLKDIAKVRGISLNKLMFEFSIQALAEDEAQQRFLAAKVRGNAKQALKMLDELDAMGL
jgi:predicted transcriptional regulator